VTCIPFKIAILWCIVSGVGACSRAVTPLVSPGQSAVALTGGPNHSMIYLARTSEGIVVIDLGWWGYERPLTRALQELGGSADDVKAVFLTHSHRDHISAWRSVSGAQFHLASSEYPRLIGDSTHQGWIPELADQIKPPDRPRAGELNVQTFGRDTAFVVGDDTVRAYMVAGHTEGSAAYLFRGILFIGDAMTYSSWAGFSSARRGYSDDAATAAESLKRLWPRLPADGVRYVCTAHAACAPFSPELSKDVSRL
jgi:glyoxylase-like metal-dependent hydrolase (beta-lactamase superfamily II)